jgi:hypothetical protein
METRRNRRIKQRRARRTVVAIASIGVLGIAVGLVLPRSTTASALLLAIALVSMVTAVWNASTTTALRDRFSTNVVAAADSIRAATQRAFSPMSLDEFDAEFSDADVDWTWSDTAWGHFPDTAESVRRIS